MRSQAGTGLKIDGIGCAGMLLLLLLVASVISGAFPRDTRAEAVDDAAEVAGLGTLDPADTATLLPTPTLANTATVPPTYTPLPSMTSLPLSSQTQGSTPLPTATATLGPNALATEMVVNTQWLPTISDDAATATMPPPTATNTPLPLPTLEGGISYTVRVPILMYHYISEPPEDADVYRTDLSVSPANFRSQMTYLVQNGYSTITLYDLSLAIAGKQQLPPKPVILTFDDGYLDNYHNAFPVLNEFGLRGTFFVVSGYLDQQLPQYMTWAMVKEMAAAGQDIEPHSRTHPDLRDREIDYLESEIVHSQRRIAEEIGYWPRFFAYPGGTYDETVLEALEQFDFWGAVTTSGAWWHGYDYRYEWGRLRMRNTTTLGDLAWMLNASQ
jgi:peptidoglycan/xylan/chitin deacetylase (PgdA/CDA1 family)